MLGPSYAGLDGQVVAWLWIYAGLIVGGLTGLGALIDWWRGKL